MNTLPQLLELVRNVFDEENFLFEPKGLYEPIDYTLSLGGKRIRPVMLMAAHEMFGGKALDVKDAALGIETFHNFTLLHDDLMDKSPLRRGKETVYRKWNENTAILSGDTMLSLAWRYFLRKNHPQLQHILTTFNETGIEVYEGQQFDMEFETRSNVSIEEYINMIRLKTAVLLAGALKIGAIYAGAPEADIERLYQWGIHIGLAFQIQDDLLDAYGDTSTFGKQTGTDIKDNKKTYLYLRALEMADPAQRQTLQALFAITPLDPTEKIEKVLEIYSNLNIKQEVEKAIHDEFLKAEEMLNSIALNDEKKATLQQLRDALLGRKK